MNPADLTGKISNIERTPIFTGSYSAVYRGFLKDAPVAIKVIKGVGTGMSMHRKFRREQVVWASLNHPNILPFCGFAQDEIFQPFGAFISPWCQYGHLHRYLEDYGHELTVNQRVELWKDTITGVAFLHSRQPPLIHGDIKPGNVLVNDSGIAVLCDFGLIQILLDEGSSGLTTTSEHTGTQRYLAPELVSQNGLEYPIAASDIYGLCCLGLELVFGQRTYVHRESNRPGRIFADIKNGVPPAQRPENVDIVTSLHWNLIQACWNRDPDQRPPAWWLLDQFSEPTTVKRGSSYLQKPRGPLSHVSLDMDETEIGADISGDPFTGSLALNKPQDLSGNVSLDTSQRDTRGGYSSVYQGMYNSEPVAVKVLRVDGTRLSRRRNSKRETSMWNLEREASIWATVTHPNVQPFYGVDLEISPFGALVSPWCINGDAGQFLHENGDFMSPMARIELWKGVINGVVYLHGHNPTVVHGDLKSVLRATGKPAT